MVRRVLLMVCVVVLGRGVCPVWGETVIHVSKGGSDGNTGVDWETAKLTVQAGLNAASSGGQVWVAAGTYVERITLKAGVGLYGGFAGGEMELSQRDWKANETILDGNQQPYLVTAPEGASQTTRIDGFTIRNGGYAGVYCSESSPTIANNTITGNWGGGVSCLNSSAVITANTIRRNSTDSDGGGIYCEYSSPTIDNNFVTENVATNGGGIHCSDSSATITNNTIRANRGMYGGGMRCSGSSPRIINNMITGNGSTQGGGILCTYDSSPAMVNNTILGNSAPAGGGVFCDDTSGPAITNTIIAFNSSGIRRSGVTPGSLVLRHNCVFGNSEGDYSGVADPTGTEGNLSVDPKLAGAAYGNWHIQTDSPCVDAGDTASASGDFDLDGQARIWPAGGTVDIGADESDGTVWAAGPYVIVRVSPDGDDAHDGSDWSTAKRTVQGGIDVVSALGGEVWVREGTYWERIMLHPYTYLYGGFSGAEMERDQRDARTHITILDGQREGSVVTVLGGYAVSVIDGLTITNGLSMAGGGILCSYASPMISGNIITGNEAFEDGGGIHCLSASPMIAGNVVMENIASGYGSGICCMESSPTVIDNLITKNLGFHWGGGIWLFLSSSIIANNLFTENNASYGGGITCNLCNVTIVNNTIAGNSATYEGGGIACDDSAATIVHNRIVGNTAGINGGGIRCRGVFYTGYYPTIVNNTITANDADYGGGTAFIDSYGTVENTIIAFNSSGVYRERTRAPTFGYSCVYGNAGYEYFGMDDPTGTEGNVSGDPVFVRKASPGADGVWGTEDDDYGDLRLRRGSACVDAGDNAKVPKDKADVDGDGNRTEQLPVDLAGRPRFEDDATVDTGLGSPPIVDIGAYERRASVAADLDWDDDVDGFDFLTFANCYNGSDRALPPGCASLESDFEGDGDVDGFDFLTFANCYNGSDRAAVCP